MDCVASFLFPGMIMAFISSICYTLSLFKKDIADREFFRWAKHNVDFSMMIQISFWFSIFPFGTYLFNTIFNYMMVVLYFALWANPGVHGNEKNKKRMIFASFLVVNWLTNVATMVGTGGYV